MKKSIADLREEYTKESLKIEKVSQNPIDQFLNWFENAVDSAVNEPNAMNLSTSSNGKVSSRIVLLKGVENNNFIFYTNYESEKGKQIADNPYVALTFFWPELERQIRIEGLVKKVDTVTSDIYFKSRPRASQIGAWVSPQSKSISDRTVLDQRLVEIEKKFNGKEVERPAHWGGYAITPTLIEFWQGRPSRLHDRLCYTLEETGSWKIERLAP
ncbi:pyridoxamine 5'-phosphate oxidase [Marivirga sp. S37H4]|uniref:Pyridoxine/pyridoxamine 5'-phosphate oxidase n=1 Tax=Marivirga aurantiaca TaxID=2802615 RepID=A0A935C792_9BACT|nr:pyridoxamine 5'-phosphate oxidase [Marivirga aurantiaca]MBK6264222.1 pyridoxamine 5'-phosphate oxidase [Marivirga aurantiaca]